MSTMSETVLKRFATAVVHWQKKAGRHDLPWQQTRDPYKIWLSEIMLQQTQVSTAIGYYERFLDRYPTLQALALAPLDEVMPYWAGLGYYARARNLHRCAGVILEQYNGDFPKHAREIMQLPGIGRSTANAIAAFAYRERNPIMDGNVRRVFSRYFGIEGRPGNRSTENALWQSAAAALEAAPSNLDIAAYTQGLMDLGATCCVRRQPACIRCPLSSNCRARIEGRQHELPEPRLKKPAIERHCKMLILQSRNAILLEQRPSPGIWGGLLSLPQFDDFETMHAACLDFSHNAAQARKVAIESQAFSHFTLRIEAWHLAGETFKINEPGPARSWVAIDTLGSAALPAPVKRLLKGVFGEPARLPIHAQDDSCRYS